jgi:hypothetical protein
MWLVINKTPYSEAGAWVQDKNSNKIWLVVVKATFDIHAGGSTRLSEEQVPVLRIAEPVGEISRSLTYESDLLGIKPSTDVLVNGSAWVPDGKNGSSVDVQLVVGPIKKRLRVFGNRIWERGRAGISISRAQPFRSMPIKYERAYGGWDRSSQDPADYRMEDRNPVGTGFSIREEHCVGMRLPNIEYPDQLIRSWHNRPSPAGLNAIDCSWSPRRQLAGTYDEEWQRNRFPLWAEDFDQRYYNCAPSDQQVQGILRGGEKIDLVNLSPEGRLVFALPTIYPCFQTKFGQKRVEHRAKLCTVIVEPEFPRVIMAWQTYLVCNHQVDELDATVVTEKRLI